MPHAFVEIKEVKLSKLHKSLVIAPPMELVEKLHLTDKRDLVIYMRDNMIVLKPLPLNQKKPKFECWIRKILIEESRTRLTIPAPIIDQMQLKAGDILRVRLGELDGRWMALLKPKSPRVYVRVKHNEDGNSILEIHPVMPDGTPDKSRQPVIKEVPYAYACQIVDEAKDGDTDLAEKELAESQPVYITVTRDEPPPKFIVPGKPNPIPKGKEDDSSSVQDEA